MSGKLCFGVPTANGGAANLKQSKAYCDGMHYRAGGTAAEKPITDNPHLADSPDATTWDLGWMQADSFAGSSMTRDDCYCCANPGAIQA